MNLNFELSMEQKFALAEMEQEVDRCEKIEYLKALLKEAIRQNMTQQQLLRDAYKQNIMDDMDYDALARGMNPDAPNTQPVSKPRKRFGFFG